MKLGNAYNTLDHAYRHLQATTPDLDYTDEANRECVYASWEAQRTIVDAIQRVVLEAVRSPTERERRIRSYEPRARSRSRLTKC